MIGKQRKKNRHGGSKAVFRVFIRRFLNVGTSEWQSGYINKKAETRMNTGFRHKQRRYELGHSKKNVQVSYRRLIWCERRDLNPYAI